MVMMTKAREASSSRCAVGAAAKSRAAGGGTPRPAHAARRRRPAGVRGQRAGRRRVRARGVGGGWECANREGVSVDETSDGWLLFSFHREGGAVNNVAAPSAPAPADAEAEAEAEEEEEEPAAAAAAPPKPAVPAAAVAAAVGKSTAQKEARRRLAYYSSPTIGSAPSYAHKAKAERPKGDAKPTTSASLASSAAPMGGSRPRIRPAYYNSATPTFSPSYAPTPASKPLPRPGAHSHPSAPAPSGGGDDVDALLAAKGAAAARGVRWIFAVIAVCGSLTLASIGIGRYKFLREAGAAAPVGTVARAGARAGARK